MASSRMLGVWRPPPVGFTVHHVEGPPRHSSIVLTLDTFGHGLEQWKRRRRWGWIGPEGLLTARSQGHSDDNTVAVLTW